MMKIKLITIGICFLIPLCAKATENFATEISKLPSNEEIMQKGQLLLKEVDQKFIQAEKSNSISPTSSIDTNSNPAFKIHPATKELSQDLFATLKSKNNSILTGGVEQKYELILFVSFSMPDDVLTEYARQAKEVGATIVMRGFVDGTLPKTQKRVIEVNKALAPWDIAPPLFRKFKVETVPSFVLAETKKGSALEDGCLPENEYLKVDGEISIRQSLLNMRIYGEKNLGKVAGEILARVEDK